MHATRENIKLEDCSFYTVQDIPGLDRATTGPWDLRPGVDSYLGNVDFAGKSVLELGPASGFLTFHMEKLGASVTSVELSRQDHKWDAVPLCNQDWVSNEAQHRENNLKGVQNAYWFAHKAFNSKAKIIYSHINDIPDAVGTYDISLLGSVLLHLQNPFVAIQNMLIRTRETAIITDLLPDSLAAPKTLKSKVKSIFVRKNTTPFVQFLPGLNKPHDFAWWLLSPAAVVNMASIFGFEDCKVTYHSQLQNGQPNDMFTVVCRRTIPIEKCYYK